ncbi:hypothetical protein R1flu_023187 [Riccia fluitans]|uniref:Uncharacterized protein n=1 Tax=Riccia fluitans TaxID=41844 RepID=A0ABD1XRB0_9MARC
MTLSLLWLEEEGERKRTRPERPCCCTRGSLEMRAAFLLDEHTESDVMTSSVWLLLLWRLCSVVKALVVYWQ